jgi:hypothetical protein
MEALMSKRFLVLPLALAAALAGGPVPDAAAAAQRTFVASTGSDANVCNLSFPCRSFGAAIAQTLSGGEVIVLDSAGYGAATITQPVSIIAPPGIYAGVSVIAGGATGGVGIIVNVGTGKVTLRGLSINSLGGTTGISFLSGTALYLDNVTVSNFPTAGLSASVGASASVFITRSTFHDNGAGAVFNAAAGTLTASVDGVLFARNGTGASFQDGTAGSVHASTLSGGTTGISVAPPTATLTAAIEVRDCTISDNAGVGVDATQTGAGSPLTLVSVVSSQVSGNGIGIQVTGSNSSAYVSDSTITRNATGVSPASLGTIVSGGDNRLVNNAADGAFSSTVLKL